MTGSDWADLMDCLMEAMMARSTEAMMARLKETMKVPLTEDASVLRKDSEKVVGLVCAKGKVMV